MKIFKGLEQGSDEWFNARCGLITASTFDKILTPTGKLSAQSTELVSKKVAEVLTGKMEDSFSGSAMERGVELESEALEFVKMVTDIDFSTVGFIDSEFGYGCSPDAMCEDKKIGLEIKCPLAHTQVKYLRDGIMPKKYIPQVQGSMLVTGFDEWYFVSYHPEIKSLTIKVKSSARSRQIS